MKKSDLKDGMVLTIRSGDKYRFISSDHHLFRTGTVRGFCGLHLKYYKDDLMYDDSSAFRDNDIMEVSYMGETLWERKEYYTLKEAHQMIHDGKGIKLKHKDSTTWFTAPHYALLNATVNTLSDMWELLEAKKFEVM